MGCAVVPPLPDSTVYDKREIMEKTIKKDHTLLFIMLFMAFLMLVVLVLVTVIDLPKRSVETEPPETEPTEAETESINAKEYAIYPGAIEDYLGKNGDYTTFSSKRRAQPEFVMIHFCSAIVNHREDPYNMEYVRQNFINSNVSVHYILDRDGTVYCYIPESRAAWHAGKGTWRDDPKYENNMNRYAIGIELVGIGSQADMSIYLSKAQYDTIDDSLKGFTDAQYASLKDLVAYLCQKYDIPMSRDHIIGHEEYTDRKNDPGELFDWSRILPMEKK